MTTRPSLARAWPWLLLGGLALAFGQGHWPHGLVLIAGIACTVRFFRLAPPLLAGLLFVVIHALVWEWAYAGMVPMPTAARVGMEAGTSLMLALVLLADRFVARRVSSFVATLTLPCGWIAFDLASARLSPGGTWGSIAYSFADDVLVAQVASLVGWTGLTFIAAWIASVVNWIADQPREAVTARRRGVAIVAVVVGAIVAFGAFRLGTTPDAAPIRVACVVAPNTFEDATLEDVWAYTRGVEAPAASTARAQARIGQSRAEHFALVERAAAAGARLVVWPEANAVLTDAEEPAWIEQARTLAMQQRVFIGMGMVVFRPASRQPTLNKLVLVDPAGDVVVDFLKATRPPGSSNARGDGILPLVDTELGRVSTAICFDLDFPQLIAQAGAGGVDLFLAPSNDWIEVRDVHARMARLRAIEQGFALVRPTKDGRTLITDATGNTLGSLALDDNRTGMIVADVPAAHRRTLYARLGDAFAWIGVAGLIALSVGAVVTGRGPTSGRSR